MGLPIAVGLLSEEVAPCWQAQLALVWVLFWGGFNSPRGHGGLRYPVWGEKPGALAPGDPFALFTSVERSL